jgi:two-component system sensor histidine kinase AgrC
VPLTYYLLEYGITVYSDLLYSGGPAVAEFLDAAIVVVYFIFSVLYLKISRQKRKIALEKTNLELLMKEAEYEITSLKEAQKIAAIYRHDMRHHLALIKGYLADGAQQNALDYIRLAEADIEKITPANYCRNNAVNLIFSSYAAKAKGEGVTFMVDADLPQKLAVSETELCALLSNGLENALSAAAKVEDKQLRKVRVSCHLHKGNLLILIENSFTGDVTMENGLPQSQDDGHGFGVKSMALIAEKHRGYYSFAANNGIFTVKIVLPPA